MGKGASGDFLKDDMGKPYGRSTLYLIMRLVERVPTMVPSDTHFFLLPPDKQAHLLAYEAIREAEELEVAALGLAKGI